MLLGDMIAKFTQMVGVKPCPPCKKRQEALNKWHAQMTGQQPRVSRTFEMDVDANGNIITTRPR